MNYFPNLNLALLSNRRLLFDASASLHCSEENICRVLANMREFWNETLKHIGVLTKPREELAVGVK